MVNNYKKDKSFMCKIFDVIMISSFFFILIISQRVQAHDSVSLAIIISISYFLIAYCIFRNYDNIQSKLYWFSTDLTINETVLMFLFKVITTIAFSNLLITILKIF